MKDKPRLLSVFDLFVTLAAFVQQGSLSRFQQQYQEYSKSFKRTYIKTYGEEEYPSFPDNVEVIPFHKFPMGRYFYFLFSGFRNYRPVDYVEMLDPRAIMPALIYKVRGAKLFLDYRWNTALTSWQEKSFKGYLGAILSHMLHTLAFKAADTIGVSTKRLGDEVRKYTREDKIYLLPNFVDTNLFKPLGTKKVDNLLVCVSRLSKEKNLMMLLEVMKGLPQYHLRIIGGGVSQEKLIAFKEREGIANVSFLGMIPNEELPQYLNQAQAFILVSFLEGHPKALIEAMACGLPCIGTNVAGINDVITDGQNGYLCEVDSQSIRNCIMEVFQDREKMKEIGERARKFAIENYSFDKIIRRRIKLITGDTKDITPLFSSD